MGKQGDRILEVTAERGFPDPWRSFGQALCEEAAHSTALTRAIADVRKNGTEENHAEVERIFADKAANLQHCAAIIDQVVSDFDDTGQWNELDNKVARLDIPDVLESWGRSQSLHPFPVVLKSLEYNWTYMKEHGVRGFYQMTRGYITRLQENTTRWRTAWATEVNTGIVDRMTSIECDLASVEAPMHCDVCEKTITAVLFLDE